MERHRPQVAREETGLSPDLGSPQGAPVAEPGPGFPELLWPQPNREDLSWTEGGQVLSYVAGAGDKADKRMRP